MKTTYIITIEATEKEMKDIATALYAFTATLMVVHPHEKFIVERKEVKKNE